MSVTTPGLAFGSYGSSSDGERRWATSLLTSTAIYAAMLLLLTMLGGKQIAQVVKKVVDVKFVEKIAIEPPPPAPVAPIPEVKPEAPAAMAPVVRPDQKVRK